MTNQLGKRNLSYTRLTKAKIAPEFQHLVLEKKPIKIMEKVQGMEFTRELDDKLDNDHEALRYIGTMNFSKMAAANLCFPIRNSPLAEDYTNKDNVLTERVGQIKREEDGSCEIEGVGRRMVVTDEKDMIVEGQFENKKLHGFGRELTIFSNNEFEVHIGWWDNGVPHGYGRHLWRSGHISEGLYDQGTFLKDAPAQFMRTYPDDVLIAQKVDWADICINCK